MQHSQTHLRSRPISAGHLRAFEAVARHLNFRAAAEEMALTQSAVSRQIQSLEEEVGVSLFLRHTRAVELTSAGAQLLLSVQQSLPRIDMAVRQIRQSAGRKSVSLTTFASFASMWLIPRLEAFQRDNPEIDIRIDASDVAVDLEVADVDIALRYGPREAMPPTAVRLFGENLTPVASPWLIKSSPPIKTPEDITRFTLIEAGDAHRTHLEWLTWRRWFEVNGLERAQPKRWLYFNYAYQMVQAALTGQGVVLARSSLIAESLANGDLVEVLPQHRMDSPMSYWLIAGPRNALRPEIKAFWDWLLLQADTTRGTIGEVPDPDTIDDID
ncbi:DNA-binding transcriptional LysR family regulator [Variovorax boronicumulans]|jgi:LysR family glycine cleavage system transcriptional activator|uniref:DNA-binding transcriptional LysR family regulator n=2 Tax=Variovorax TaxID=34072 RepID=A0AAW8D1D5_9BURK|nr:MULTISPECIES: LysR substrate-binding domain-containing protein [Variovorax]ADU35279.1 transcriptional regulator, LysR family [Variovorax paradoxus EPS]MDP9895266.1 DNA-binding transcriptional LysR family regulator [Variovorax boronicumulans]MDP9992619.1 DNA-binding transcriptional LysR family regulator [Variovorax boronicumulans]MDQ0002209.1 DNA-binding transcriptional LysR family regulator [Variovorax boronicumulans]MDQ0042130.1 DNA-binding transcriptional LysR family regulator [Variovorax